MDYVGRYYQEIDDSRIVCNLCPRYCTLREGQRGFCFVRQNINHQMILTTYGRSSGFCIDPIEKKPLNHFYPGTGVLSFGTAGCNLGCKFCQNWSISKSREWDRLTEEAQPEAIAEAAHQWKCKSVAFTYNDPVIFAEYAMDIADACHDYGVKTVAVTAGYIAPEARKDFFSKMDAANVDLKGFSERFYKKLTSSSLQPVLETLEFLKRETSVWFEITNLMIPGENDSEEEVRSMCQWIAQNLGPDVPLHFTAFHPDFKMMDHPATPHRTLLRARSIAQEVGIQHVYVGNVSDWEASSTYCSECGELLIERNWYQLGKYNLSHGKCRFCGALCQGHFDIQPGNWGPRRVPLSLELEGN